MHIKGVAAAIRTALTLLFLAAAAISTASANEKKHVSLEAGVPVKDFCSPSHKANGEKVGLNEMREFKLPVSGRIDVDGGKNGGIALKGGDVSEITVRACVNAWATSEAAVKELVNSVKINTSGTIRAESSVEDSSWGVSYQITVPRRIDAKLNAKNGGISIVGVEGDLEFTTVNGGISLKGVGGSARGRTTNGGLSIVLMGSSWNGSGLDVSTTNGGINLMLPENYSANIETGTINGGFRSEIAALNVERTEHSRASRLSAAFNGGGPQVRVITTNGGVKIGALKDHNY